VLVGILLYLLSFSTALLAILAAVTGESFRVWGGEYIPLAIDVVLAALVVSLVVALLTAIRRA